jgi:hypothetical protein
MIGGMDNNDAIIKRGPNGEPWYVVARASTMLNAEIVAGLLRNAGIPVLLFREAAGSSAIPLTIGAFGVVEIAVPEAHYGEALALLRDDDDDDGSDFPPAVGKLFGNS